MHQFTGQSKSPCWHKSGWNEKSNQRKKRKKQDNLIYRGNHHINEESECPCIYQASSLNTLPRMKILSLIIMPIILFNIAPYNVNFNISYTNCQLIVGYPKTSARGPQAQANLFRFPPFNPTLIQDSSKPPHDIEDNRSFKVVQDLPSSDNITNYSTLPSSREKQDELLRKLSSTMLMDTLLRHPISTNKSPFPSLSMLTGMNSGASRETPSSNEDLRSLHRSRPRPVGTRKTVKQPISTGILDVSTTNRTIVTDKDSPSEEVANLTPAESDSVTESDGFNARSLNYLVDKLLNVQPFRQDILRKRPSRRKSPYEEVSNIPADPPHNDQNLISEPYSNNVPITLDVLIRDEYNSRVEPMLKSLMDQRKLSSPSSHHKNNTTPNNHKLDAVDNDFSATTSPSSVDRLKNNSRSTTRIKPQTVVPIDLSSHNMVVALEDLEDFEDDEEFDDELDDINLDPSPESDKKTPRNVTKVKSKSTSKVKEKKILQNVPPYQLGNNFGPQSDGNRNPPTGLNSSQSVIQATTVSSTDQKNAQDAASARMSSTGEKITDTSVRDSLVFSDEADEGRANRKRNNPNRAKNNTDSTSSGSNLKRKKESVERVKNSSGSRHNERIGDSFLLDLFSTISPLTDLEKLKESYNIKDTNNQNPLLYKGYVGKDDYLLSTTARDWSRPLTNREATTPVSSYKYLYNNQQPTVTTPVAPIQNEPPSTLASSYFPNQPVTNAQSVPTMVIPTSDPLEITTPHPLAAGFEPNRRKIIQIHPNPQLGGGTHPADPDLLSVNHPYGFESLLHNTSHKPVNELYIHGDYDKKYSYRIPDRQLNKTRQQQVNAHTNLHKLGSNISKPVMDESDESSELDSNNGGKSGGTLNSKLSTIVDRNWSPSKMVQISQQDQKRLRMQPAQNNSLKSIFLSPTSPMNLSSPILVPFVGMKSFGSTPLMSSMIQSQAKTSPIDISMNGVETISAGTSPPTMRPMETTAKHTSEISGLREVGGHQERRSQKNFTQTDGKLNNFQQNKLKISKKESSQQPSVTAIGNESDGLLGDTDSEQDGDEDNRGGNSKKSKRPTISRNRNHHVKSDSDESSFTDYQGESGESSDDQVPATEPPKIAKKQPKNRTRTSNTDQQSGSNDQSNEDLKQNKTKKSSSSAPTKHDTAGSEISMVGLDKNLQQPTAHRNNQTSRFIASQKQQPPQVNTETITLGGSEGDGVSYKPATNSDTSSPDPTSFGSSIIPNSNFVGEASSDSPTLDSSIPAILNGRLSSKVHKQPAHITTSTDDAYQRISSSNSVVSAVLQPTSKVMITTDQPSSTTEISRKQEDSLSGSSRSANDPVATKPSTKGTSDRLAFILICGSCFLSVVCLVLAAMSVRCPDMFDDYRYMRNAERAALRLQKHRLRYTKNHQINRYNHGGGGNSSPENSGLNLIDDLNIQTSTGAEPDLMRNPTKCLNNRPAQFDHAHCKKTADTNILWNAPSGSQQALPTLLNKENPSCRCANCSNLRWSSQQEDLMAANKHLSWLHPYFYMQNQSRLRPLFGAGSSVGTFFPRRMDDQKLHSAGGSIDAQMLIDSRLPHSCGIIDQRGATRSKSILNTSKKPLVHRHVNGLEVPQNDTSNFGCNNPAHSHSHHNCHNHAGGHHHHLHHHRCNLETSTSDGSELTMDESVHQCDSAKCSAHNQKSVLNNRLKLSQLRAAESGHTHQSTVWKPRSFRKLNSSSHHHHHHQNHHQQVSSSDASSIAQCTCSRDLQPLLQASGNTRQNGTHRTSHKLLSKHDAKQAKRDKSMLIWSTNRDRLI